MSSKELALRVSGISKRYMIAHQEEASINRVKSPLRRLADALRPAPREPFWALKDISFDVARGEVVGIIGRNGAGKSTLLKILSRITEPTAGDIDVFGRIGSLLEVGTGFHPELTGRENVFLNGAILGMQRAEIQSKFDEIVAFSGVEKFLDTPVKRYSSGMYVRLAFAVAAHLNPEILIVDEVLAVGDAEFQDKCLGKMQDVGAHGRSVLFVSHNEAAVKRLCSRAILLKGGCIAFEGTPDEAFAHYRARRDGTTFSDSVRTYSSDAIRTVDAYLSRDGIRATEFEIRDTIELTVVVAVQREVSFQVEVLIRDSDLVPVLFSPTGLVQNFNHKLPPGEYELVYELCLPKMANGEYVIDLMLSQYVEGFYDYIEQALRFVVRPWIAEVSGWEFRQSRGQGSVLFEVSQKCVQKTDHPN